MEGVRPLLLNKPRQISPQIGQNRREPLGQAAVRLGYTDPSAVNHALQEQKSRKADGGEHVRIGLLMVELGILTQQQLADIVRQFRSAQYSVTEDALRFASRLKASLKKSDQVILMTSARSNAGVSTLAAQTALAMALMGDGDVLLVDANPHGGRSKAETPMFNIEQSPGLSELLNGTARVEDSTKQTAVPALQVLPIGKVDPDFLGLLLSEDLGLHMQTLRKRFRFVFIDAPSLVDHPECALLAPRADGVVLVLPAGKVNKTDVSAMKEMMGGLNVQIYGAVLCDQSGRPKA